MNLDGVTTTQTFTPVNNTVTKPIQKEASATVNFDQTLQTTRPKEVEDKLSSMIDTIDKLKATLDFDMSVDNLNEYKKALKSFIEYYTKNELQVQNVLMTDKKGYTKKMQIVKTLNEKLSNMTSSMLETNLGHLQMLKEIGQVHGMVLNLYL